jgi:hypothetical protein
MVLIPPSTFAEQFLYLQSNIRRKITYVIRDTAFNCIRKKILIMNLFSDLSCEFFQILV